MWKWGSRCSSPRCGACTQELDIRFSVYLKSRSRSATGQNGCVLSAMYVLVTRHRHSSRETYVGSVSGVGMVGTSLLEPVAQGMAWHGVGETILVLIDEHDILSSYFLWHHESSAADHPTSHSVDLTQTRHPTGTATPTRRRFLDHAVPSVIAGFCSPLFRFGHAKIQNCARSMAGPLQHVRRKVVYMDALRQPTVAPTQSQINTDDTRHSESKHKQGGGEYTHRLDTNNKIALQRGSASVQPAKSVFFLLVLSWVGRGWIYM